jgi:hypothetical protein
MGVSSLGSAQVGDDRSSSISSIAAAAKAGALQQACHKPGSLTGVVGLVNAHLLYICAHSSRDLSVLSDSPA